MKKKPDGSVDQEDTTFHAGDRGRCPLWVNNGPRRFAERLPLYLQTRTLIAS
jgi:hypothetical protein